VLAAGWAVTIGAPSNVPASHPTENADGSLIVVSPLVRMLTPS
jgi:hypothetical protein